MRLQDLKVVRNKSLPDLEGTQSLLGRVKDFLQTAESVEPPADFESPDGHQNHIELELFIPKDNEINPDLVLPIDSDLESGGSDSSSSSSSSDVSDSEENYSCSLGSPLSKRPKIEELGSPRNAGIEEGDA